MLTTQSNFSDELRRALGQWSEPTGQADERRDQLVNALDEMLRDGLEATAVQLAYMDESYEIPYGEGFGLVCRVGDTAESVVFFYEPTKDRSSLWRFEWVIEEAGRRRREECLLRMKDGDAAGLGELRRSAGVMTPAERQERRIRADEIANALWGEDPRRRPVMESISAKWCLPGERWLHLIIDPRYRMFEETGEEEHLGVSYGMNTTPERQGILGPTLRSGDLVFGIHEFSVSPEARAIRLVDQWIESASCTELGTLAEVECAMREMLAGLTDARYGSWVDSVGVVGPVLRSGPINLGDYSYKHDSE